MSARLCEQDAGCPNHPAPTALQRLTCKNVGRSYLKSTCRPSCDQKEALELEPCVVNWPWFSAPSFAGDDAAIYSGAMHQEKQPAYAHNLCRPVL